MTLLLALAFSAIVVVLLAYLEPGPPPPPPKPKALHAALPGCFMCVLSASAGDDYLDLHVLKDHAA